MTTGLATVRRVGLATVQDAGRPGLQEVGVPVAGAWHRGRYRLACALLAGDPDISMPTIEVLAGELDLHIDRDVAVVVTGPARAHLGRRTLATGTVVLASAGSLVSIVPNGPGPIYVSISGWVPEGVLGSCSTDTFSRLGGPALAVGDVLDGGTDPAALERVGWFHRPTTEPSGPIRVVAVDADLAESFFARRWRVDRMARSGTRLRSAGWQGPSTSLESFPVLPGAIQLTPDHEAIVLGPDGALTGGYPVVGVVASIDLDRMSALAPGGEVTFAALDRRAAVALADVATRARSRLLAHPSALG